MKILVIEPQCRGWEHEQVNAAFLSIVAEHESDKEIIFCAEQSHIDCIDKLFVLREKITTHAITLPVKSGDTMKFWKEYYILFRTLLNEFSGIEKVLFLSSHKGNMYAINKLAKELPQIKYIITVHALVEQLKRKCRLRDRLFKDNFFYGWGLREIMNRLSKKENIKFVTYSPTFVEQASDILKKKTLDKIYFINIPYMYGNPLPKVKEDKIIIGLIGGAVNDNARILIEDVVKADYSEGLEFRIIRTDQDFSNLKNVVVINEGKSISREQIEEECQYFDYMLLAYDKTMYGMSASGVFFDAINYEIPILMLNSPFLEWYNNKYQIGIQAQTVEELAREIKEIVLSNNRNEELYINIKKTRKYILQENIELLKKVME